MTTANRSTPLGAIVGLFGGVLLVLGSFMTWASVSFNLDVFAKVISDATGVSVSPSQLSSLGLSPTTQRSSGLSNDGKFTLIAGVIVVACAVLVIVVENARMVGRIVMALAGAVGALVAILNLLTKDSQIDDALSKVESQLRGSGISLTAFRSVFNVDWGIGIYLCAVGGIVAIVGAVMATGTSTPSARVADQGFVPGSGFGAPPAVSAPISGIPPAPPHPEPVEPDPPSVPQPP
jgi:hypothetical protein